MEDLHKALILDAALQDIGLPGMEVGKELLAALKMAGMDLVEIQTPAETIVRSDHYWQPVPNNSQKRCKLCFLWQTDDAEKAPCSPRSSPYRYNKAKGLT